MALFLLLAAGCRSTPKLDTPASQPAPSVPAKPPSVAGKSGGYYLDDGPGANTPPNLDAIPDAVPRAEPLHRGAMRPYTVMGRHYTPMTALAPYKARGVASWYGRRYHGKPTSSGESYDMYAMTAAHTTLPLPSYVRVTNLANGRSVVVRVNDRGPFIDNRLIDLSYTAAHRLGTLAGGSAMVEVELLLPGAAVASLEPAVVPAPSATPAPQIAVAGGAGASWLQLAAFGAKENAEAYAARLSTDLPWLTQVGVQMQVYVAEGLFRVQAGPYASATEARGAAAKIGQALNIKPLVIVR
jgi:rare lipoprotein A